MVIPQWELFVNSTVLNLAFLYMGKNERWEIEILFRVCIKNVKGLTESH